MDELAHRRKVVKITGEAIAAFCATGTKSFNVDVGLPENAAFVGAEYSFQERCFCVYFEHESFELVPVGESCPTLEIICSNVLSPKDDNG